MFEPSEFFHFLVKPQYQYLDRKTTHILGITIKIYLLSLLFIGLINLINITILRAFLTLPMDETIDIPASLKGHLWVYFFAVAIFAPFVEETIFRLSLVFNPINIAFSGSFLIALIIRRFSNHLISIISLFLFLFLIYRLATIYKTSLILFWYKNFRYIFYTLPVMFGLLHIFNYKYMEPSQYLIAPILIFPQLATGFILSFTRLYYKKGFLICILFHVLMNMIGVSVSLHQYLHP